MPRRPKPLRRRVDRLQPRKTPLVFCEGARTEPEYLDALRREPAVRNAAAVDIRIDRDSAGFKPLGLVRVALAARQKSLREEARSTSSGACSTSNGRTPIRGCLRRLSSP
jgi:hypothetical protein